MQRSRAKGYPRCEALISPNSIFTRIAWTIVTSMLYRSSATMSPFRHYRWSPTCVSTGPWFVMRRLDCQRTPLRGWMISLQVPSDGFNHLLSSWVCFVLGRYYITHTYKTHIYWLNIYCTAYYLYPITHKYVAHIYTYIHSYGISRHID